LDLSGSSWPASEAGGWRVFATDADVKQDLTSWLQILDRDLFYTMIEVLVP
jgi:hypothetical protein